VLTPSSCYRQAAWANRFVSGNTHPSYASN